MSKTIKIAVLQYSSSEVDIISVPLEWLNEEMPEDACASISSEEWQRMDLQDKVEIFLAEWCQYDPSDIHYMIEPNHINHLKHRDFN